MKRRHIPMSEKQQHEYAAVVDNQYINDDDLKSKNYRYQPPPPAAIIYSSNEVGLHNYKA